MVTCDYCEKLAELVSGRAIYPHRYDLAGNHFWRCKFCDAHVGTHPSTIIPLGNLANYALRAMRMKAHREFDPIWKGGRMTRKRAYGWLSERTGIPPER